MEKIKLSLSQLEIFPGPHDRIQTFLLAYKAWCDSKSWQHKLHQPVVVAGADGMPVFAGHDIQAINDCTAPACVIDNSKENPDCLKGILNRLNGNKHYVIFDGSKWHQKRLPTNHQYTLVYWPFCLLDLVQVHTNVISPYFYQKNQYNFQYPKSILFTHVSGVHRRHRDWFVDNLLPELKADSFIFRYRGQDHGINACQWDLLNQDIPEQQIPEYFKQFADNLSYRVPVRSMSLDTYDQSYFCLVIETMFYDNNSVFVTEKTGRCLLSGQPFVVASSPGYLQHLHEMGFKTYGDFWDEEYDNILDPDARCQAIKKLVKDLASFDWHHNKNLLEQIGTHNRMTFINWQHFLNNLFVDAEATLRNFEINSKKVDTSN